MVKEKKVVVGGRTYGLGRVHQKQKSPKKGINHFGAAWRPINRPDFSPNQRQS